MSESIEDGYSRNLQFDHDRLTRDICKSEDELLHFIEERHNHIQNILLEYQQQRVSVLDSLHKSRAERLSYVSERLNQVHERYVLDLVNSETAASSHGQRLTEECVTRLKDIEEATVASLNDQISSHLDNIERSYTKAIGDLKVQIGSQMRALQLEQQRIEEGIARTEEDLEDTHRSIRSAETEGVTSEQVRTSEERFQQLNYQLKEADRQKVAVRNFGRACSSLTMKLNTIRSTIVETKQNIH